MQPHIEKLDNANVVFLQQDLNKKENIIINTLNKNFLYNYSFGTSVENQLSWSDENEGIIINRQFINKNIDEGLEGAIKIASVLLHEYSHNTDKSIDHNVEFYKKFHDEAVDQNAIFKIARLLLIEYDLELAKNHIKPSTRLVKAMASLKRGGRCHSQEAWLKLKNISPK